MDEIDIFTKLILLINVSGMGLFSYLVYKELQMWREDSGERTERFIIAISNNAKSLAILLDRKENRNG